MKRFGIAFVPCIICAAMLILPANSSALLIDVNNPLGHVIYDDTTGKNWIWDLTAFTNQTYDEQNARVAAYNTSLYGGLDTWHTATLDEFTYLWLSAGGTTGGPGSGVDTIATGLTMFNPSLADSTSTAWLGRVSGGVHSFSDTSYVGITLGSYFFGPSDPPDGNPWEKYSGIGEWVCSDAAPVPEPCTLLLAGMGIAGLAGTRTLKRKFRLSDRRPE